MNCKVCQPFKSGCNGITCVFNLLADCVFSPLSSIAMPLFHWFLCWADSQNQISTNTDQYLRHLSFWNNSYLLVSGFWIYRHSCLIRCVFNGSCRLFGSCRLLDGISNMGLFFDRSLDCTIFGFEKFTFKIKKCWFYY